MQIHIACQISFTECQISWYQNKLYKRALSNNVLPSFCHSEPDLARLTAVDGEKSLC